MAERLHRGQYKYWLSGHRPHFNYISLRVDHRVNHNRAGDFGLSGQDRVDRLGRRDEPRCLHFSTPTNWTRSPPPAAKPIMGSRDPLRFPPPFPGVPTPAETPPAPAIWDCGAGPG